jgi:uncharacterized protein DUF998
VEVDELSEASKRRVKGQGTIILAFAIVFSITVVFVHIIEPEMNFGPLSLYSLGPYGFLMRTGFVFLGLAFFTLVTGLWGSAKPTVLNSVDIIVLSIAGAGLVTIGAFNTDGPGTAPTLSGLIHSSAANIWSISALVGILLFAVAFRQDGRSLAIGRLSRNLGITVMITYLGGFFVYGTYLAAVQPRLFFSLVVLWMCLIASQLRSGKLTSVATSQAMIN